MKFDSSANHPPAGFQYQDRRGLTLVELLAVIGIISVLASLLLPALSRAKSRAKRIACTSNLGQLQKASRMYSDDNNGELLPNKYGFNAASKRFVGLPGSWVVGDAQQPAGVDDIESGVLFEYAGNSRIYACPADRTKRKFFGQEFSLRRTYSLNVFLNPLSNSLVDEDREGYRHRYRRKIDEGGRPSPSEVWSFIDESGETVDSGTFAYAYFGGDNWLWWSLPGTRHAGGANITFLDGHVEYHKWIGIPDLKNRVVPPAPGKGLEDISWLLDRSPRK